MLPAIFFLNRGRWKVIYSIKKIIYILSNSLVLIITYYKDNMWF
jgi:hypothetical protein